MGAPLWCTGPAVFRESPRPGGLNEVADLPIGAHEDPGAVLSFAASDDPLRPCRFSQGSDHGVVPSGIQGSSQPFGCDGAGVPERYSPNGRRIFGERQHAESSVAYEISYEYRLNRSAWLFQELRGVLLGD